MADIKKREQARKLRSQGLSIASIAKTLGKSKSTISYWCRNILLSHKQISELKIRSLHAGTQQFIKLGEQRRRERMKQEKEAKNDGRKKLGQLTQRDLFLLGLGLYWGEGYKQGNNELGFTNSDPQMIKVFLNWVYTLYGVSRKDIVLRVSINQIHKDREDIVISYWSKITDINKNQFTKTSFIKTINKKRYENHNEYFGVLRAKVKKGSTLKYQILGSIEQLSKNKFGG